MIFETINPHTFAGSCWKCFSVMRPVILQALLDAGELGSTRTPWGDAYRAIVAAGHPPRDHDCGGTCFTTPTYIGNDDAE